ncbi:MAG: dimethyl sulfoxide reductase anchor subunit family protein, partial [Stellaceae bacterium]
MNPSASIIVFTTASGAGYGLLFWLGLGAALGLLPQQRGFALATLVLALAAITGGLASSVFHLGRPERAWRAFSQWRSSWLSREGVASIVTYVPALAFAAALWFGAWNGAWRLAPLLAALGAAATVLCTAYIYRSLKPIAQWSTNWVPANYLALAAMSGALWLAMLAVLFDAAPRGTLLLASITIVIAASLKFLYWRHIDRRPGELTAESATGLGALGRVRLFEAPHTEENYLLKEMGFAVARRHSRKLRRIAAGLGFAIPFLLSLSALASGGASREAM